MSLKPLRETVELWHRINEASSLEESLRSGNMSGFLILEDSVEAVNTLNQQVDQTMADLKSLDGVIPQTMSNTKKAVQAAMAAVAETRLKASPKIKLFSLGDPVKKASQVMANAASLTATIVSAGQTLLGSMGDYGVDVQSAETLEKTLDAAREANPDKKIPDNKAFLSAVEKSWQPSQGVGNAIKGFLGAIGLGGGTDFFGLQAKGFAADLLQATPKEIMGFLQSGPAKDNAEVDEKELAGLDDKLAAAGLDKEKLAGGESTDTSADKEGEAKEGKTKKWSDLSTAYLKTIEDQDAGKKFLNALKGDKKFTDAVADLINLEESMYRASLSSLLFEEIEFDVLKAAAAAAADEEGAQVSLALGLAKVLVDQGIEVNNVPSEKDASADPEAPVDEKQAAEEQEQAQAGLQQAVKDEAGQNQSPASAALGAIDAWVQGLSPTSQKSLEAKKRVDSLKQAVQGSLDAASSAIEKQVAKAVQQWRGEHEETLMKSRRFAKKNFDTLQQLVPQLAGAMLKKANESSVRLTKETINKTVFSYLNKKFYSEDNLLSEALISPRGESPPDGSFHSEKNPYSEDDMIRYRWLKMAGLGK